MSIDRKYSYKVLEIELPSCKHIAYHTLNLPDYGDKGWYTQISSMDAFFHGRSKMPNRSSTRQYSMYREDEWKFFVKSNERAKLPMLDGMTFSSIWEFYEHIRFNHKTRKYY